MMSFLYNYSDYIIIKNLRIFTKKLLHECKIMRIFAPRNVTLLDDKNNDY